MALSPLNIQKPLLPNPRFSGQFAERLSDWTAQIRQLETQRAAIASQPKYQSYYQRQVAEQGLTRQIECRRNAMRMVVMRNEESILSLSRFRQHPTLAALESAFQQNYHRYLEATDPKTQTSLWTHMADILLNIIEQGNL